MHLSTLSIGADLCKWRLDCQHWVRPTVREGPQVGWHFHTWHLAWFFVSDVFVSDVWIVNIGWDQLSEKSRKLGGTYISDTWPDSWYLGTWYLAWYMVPDTWLGTWYLIRMTKWIVEINFYIRSVQGGWYFVPDILFHLSNVLLCCSIMLYKSLQYIGVWCSVFNALHWCVMFIVWCSYLNAL